MVIDAQNGKLSRRKLLRGAGLGLAGLAMAPGAVIAACGGGSSSSSMGNGDLETDTIRILRSYGGCQNPMSMAVPHLQQEGFKNVEYVTQPGDFPVLHQFASGAIDVGYFFIPDLLHAIDLGLPLVLLGGAHASCWQILTVPAIKTVQDLKGKRLGMPMSVPRPGPEGFAFCHSVLQNIGLKPGRDIELVAVRLAQPTLILGNEVDAMWGAVEGSLSLLDTDFARALIDSKTDPRWSSHFCCGFFAREEFVKRKPEATKRALRAILRSFESCLHDPAAAAKHFAEQSWSATPLYASRTLEEVRFDAWQHFDPEDSVRFYGNSLYEAGVIKTTPDQVIQDSTDWRFMNAIKQEWVAAP